MDYKDFLPDYPAFTDPLFQQAIFNKQEFYKYKLAKEQEQITVGESLNHQKIIRNYISEHNNNDELLVYHEMGTGKTCVAFGVSEALKEGAAFKHCHVFARGADLLTNLMRMLVYSCSQNYPIKDVRRGDSAAEMRAIKKQLRDFYSFHTFLTFARELAQQSDEFVAGKYSNSILILDEVHNIKSGEIDAIVYAQFFRLFHLTRNRKILLLSGTPMKDSVIEIADVMNLILPLDQQMPTGAAFSARFLAEKDDQTFDILREGELRGFFRGRVSYLKAAQSVPIRYVGTSFDSKIDIPQFRLHALTMSRRQSRAYAEAFKKDTTGASSSIYSRARQASLFVFPDGTYGEEGVAKFCTRGSRGNIVLSRELRAEVDTIEKLGELSVKYASVIENILRNPRKNIYVYCSIVNGSGAILFGKILELYGFAQCSGNEVMPSKRYAILTSQSAHLTRVLTYFNAPRNAQGDYCQVIIGSKKISEGFSFKNVLIEHILTLHWNETETSQAIFRATRFKSHDALLARGERDLSVQVFKEAALCRGLPQESAIDILMMQFSRQKDITIRRMDRVIKESAFDCPLTYERNVFRGADNSRECDYQVCEYKCDSSSLERTQVDNTTYELYYSNYLSLVDKVIQLFSASDALSFATLSEIVQAENQTQLVKCLAYLIGNNVVIPNRYGYACYLRENKNIYFLVNDLSIPIRGFKDASANGYVRRPLLSGAASLAGIVQTLEAGVAARVLDDIEESKSREDIVAATMKLPPAMVDAFLESLAEHVVKGRPRTQRVEWLLDVYRDRIDFKETANFDAVIRGFRGARCLKKNKTWVQCKVKEKAAAAAQPADLARPPPAENAPYLGIVQDDKFCIQNLRDVAEGASADKRKRKSGAVCVEAGWKKNKLVDVCITLGLPVPAAARSPATFWGKQTKKALCDAIQKDLTAKNLVIEGSCGTARKKKT